MHEINGRTRIFGILGDPIHHVKTPQAINALFRERGSKGVMVPFHVEGEDLQTVVGGLAAIRNLAGFVVTVPHKTAALRLCEEVSPTAAMAGAVNVVRRDKDGRLTGDLLDGIGFLAGLRRAGHDPAGRAVLLAGAGGAASAIALALAGAGIRRLTIANRSREKATELARRIGAVHPGVQVQIGPADPTGHDVIVNATSLGLSAGDPLPLDTGKLTTGQLVCEVIMDPAVTPLMEAAREKNCTVHPGSPMLAAQVQLMADFLEGVQLAAAV